MDGVILPNLTEVEDVGDGALIKPYHPVAFWGGFLHEAALPGAEVDRDIPSPLRGVYSA